LLSLSLLARSVRTPMMNVDLQSPTIAPSAIWSKDLSAPPWAVSMAARKDAATLITSVVEGFRHLDAAGMRQQVVNAYAHVRATVARSPHRYVVRMWNFIPGIGDSIDQHQDRYMVFNSGRFTAMREWFAASGVTAARQLPSASGVGHGGDDLIIQALAVAEAGEAVENPDQIPAYQYSSRYGPMPPCFARATRIAAPYPAVLISGTAAITGEETRCRDDLHGQFNLTLKNLAAVIHEGHAAAGQRFDAPPLDALRHARIYVPPVADEAVVERLAADALGRNSCSVEFIRAELCRRELLVEIEGVASMQ
jgi:chorismate lyase / 3-hydroxybenzoate synthase